MDTGIFGIAPLYFVMACGVALFGGFVKGAVGFAMPMIMISGLSSFLPAPVALAALILATVVANVLQAFRQGGRAAFSAARDHWRMMAALVIMVFVSAPLVLHIPPRVFLLLLGVPLLVFSVSQLFGAPLVLHPSHRHRAEYMMGAVAGFFGGISGVWGPPVIAYLLSFNVEKADFVRVQGVIYLLGSAMLVASHLNSGILNAETAPLSAALVVPALAGLWLGFRLQDRLDPARFRKATLVILSVAALNLIRKGLSG